MCAECLDRYIKSIQKKHEKYENFWLYCPFDKKKQYISHKTNVKEFAKNFLIVDYLNEL